VIGSFTEMHHALAFVEIDDHLRIQNIASMPAFPLMYGDDQEMMTKETGNMADRRYPSFQTAEITPVDTGDDDAHTLFSAPSLSFASTSHETLLSNATGHDSRMPEFTVNPGAIRVYPAVGTAVDLSRGGLGGPGANEDTTRFNNLGNDVSLVRTMDSVFVEQVPTITIPHVLDTIMLHPVKANLVDDNDTRV
jgi:hypothetical protein